MMGSSSAGGLLFLPLFRVCEAAEEEKKKKKKKKEPSLSSAMLKDVSTAAVGEMQSAHFLHEHPSSPQKGALHFPHVASVAVSHEKHKV